MIIYKSIPFYEIFLLVTLQLNYKVGRRGKGDYD